MLMAYEITRDLPTESVEIETPICKTTGRKVLGKKLAIVPILRAGLGMVDGFLSCAGRQGRPYRPVPRPGDASAGRYYFKMPRTSASAPS